MRKGLDGLAQILEAGGARRIYTSHAGWVSYDPGNGERASRCSRRPTTTAGAPPR